MDIERLKALKEYSILYVEDDKENVEEMARVFSRFFANVYVAEDGEKGLNCFKDKSPDIILTDIHMPNMDGIEMIESIRELNKKVPIIIITAFSEDEKQEKLNNIYINKFIVKPIDLRKLIQIILDLAENNLKKGI